MRILRILPLLLLASCDTPPPEASEHGITDSTTVQTDSGSFELPPPLDSISQGSEP